MLWDFCLVCLSGHLPLELSHCVMSELESHREATCGCFALQSQPGPQPTAGINRETWEWRRFHEISAPEHCGAGMTHSHSQKPWEIRKNHCCSRSSLFGEPEMEKHLTYPWEMCSNFQKHSADLLFRSKDKRESTPVGFLTSQQSILLFSWSFVTFLVASFGKFNQKWPGTEGCIASCIWWVPVWIRLQKRLK